MVSEAEARIPPIHDRNSKLAGSRCQRIGERDSEINLEKCRVGNRFAVLFWCFLRERCMNYLVHTNWFNCLVSVLVRRPSTGDPRFH